MKELRIQRILYVTGLFIALLFILIPVVFMLVMSFSENPELFGNSFDFTFRHFHSIMTTSSLHFPQYCLNSIVVSFVSALFCTIIAGSGAYAFTRFNFPGRLILLVSVLTLSMFPQISIVSYLFRLIASVGLVNTYTGLILPYTAWILPLSMWILISYFSQIPRDLDRAAFIDGCSPLRALWSIIIPIAGPGLFSTFLLSFIFAFNEFMFALMLTVDHQTRTVPVGISLFQGLHGEIPWGPVMAASAITTAPVIILTLLFQKYIIQGLTRGAIKE